MFGIINKFIQKNSFIVLEKDAVEAYDIWSFSYDDQPGNLMLDLDDLIFGEIIEKIDLQNKLVADIGCGTGRHWKKIYDRGPALLMGFDVSAGMLNQLIQKFPSAETHLITDNLLSTVADASVDCVVTTLTIAHIKNIDEAISSWCRILKMGGDLIITDFHPNMLAKGGKRSFNHNDITLSVLNYIHPLDKVNKIFSQSGMSLVNTIEKKVNEDVRPYYESQNAMPIYNRFMGMPIIYGLLLKKQGASQ